MNSKIPKQRFIELDALRGIAALMVLLSHYTWAYDYHFNLLSEHVFHFPYGGYGVQIFFIISGFVIFMTLENVTTVKQFAISRFSRLYPTYWICMLLTILVLALFPVPTLGHFGLFQIAVNTSMIQGFVKVDHIDQVYWSLCIELAFYVIMGFVFYFKKLQHIELIALIWLLLCLISLYVSFPFKKYISVIFILKFAPLFISGIMFYKIKTNNYGKINHFIILLSLAVFLLGTYADHQISPFSIVPCVIVIIAFSLFYIFSYFSIKFLTSKTLLFFGAISFPLYLLHNVIGYAIIYRIRAFANYQIVYVLITTLISVFLAFLISKFIEKPSGKFLKTKLSQILLSQDK